MEHVILIYSTNMTEVLASENNQNLRHYHWFRRRITSEERAQKFHTDDVQLHKSG